MVHSNMLHKQSIIGNIIQTKMKNIKWNSKIPLNTTFGDTYYSILNGKKETEYVFINGNKLSQKWKEKKSFVIGELGFGTSLNFLVTLGRWRKQRKQNQKLLYVSVEKNPLTEDVIVKAVSQWPELNDDAQWVTQNWGKIKNEITEVDRQTKIRVVVGEAENALDEFPSEVNAWYLDGFAPDKNPEMWSKEVIKKIATKTAKGGTCATYTAAGWVRKNLEDAGFKVERKKGFGNKRHMTVGVFKGKRL